MLPIAGVNMQEATRLTREGRLKEAMDLLRAATTTNAGRTARWAPPPLGLEERTLPTGGRPTFRLPSRPRAIPKIPEGAQFEERSYSSPSGARQYKLYVPSSYRGDPLPLIIMLHGCTQDPEDFAVGTRMNDSAEAHGFLVAYPAQSQSANVSKCWNWFKAGEQQRSGGEPSIISGITREIMQQYAVDPDSVYIAGLSAGGAAASILGATHPDLYAAIGVHSGLACGAASDMPSAFAAMKQGSPGRPGISAVPTIVFHGDRDQTVNPINADNVVAQSKGPAAFRATTTLGEGGGKSYTRTVHEDGRGHVVLEQWLVHGAGHAWSGGDQTGSYADPSGPDASAEMVRFFLSHRRRDRAE